MSLEIDAPSHLDIARNFVVSLATKKALLVGAIVKVMHSSRYLAQNLKTYMTDYIPELPFLADTIAISSDPQK